MSSDYCLQAHMQNGIALDAVTFNMSPDALQHRSWGLVKLHPTSP